MAKVKSQKQDDGKRDANLPVESLTPGPVLPVEPEPFEFIGRDRLFDLYLARVAKAETVNTMRRDARAIFRDAFFEAKVALGVYLEMTK